MMPSFEKDGIIYISAYFPSQALLSYQSFL